MEIIDKIVEYHKYCETCEFRYCPQDEEPCNECLSNPVNTYSKKPVKYKEDEKLKKEEKEEDKKEE